MCRCCKVIWALTSAQLETIKTQQVISNPRSASIYLFLNPPSARKDLLWPASPADWACGRPGAARKSLPGASVSARARARSLSSTADRRRLIRRAHEECKLFSVVRALRESRLAAYLFVPAGGARHFGETRAPLSPPTAFALGELCRRPNTTAPAHDSPRPLGRRAVGGRPLLCAGRPRGRLVCATGALAGRPAQSWSRPRAHLTL